MSKSDVNFRLPTASYCKPVQNEPRTRSTTMIERGLSTKYSYRNYTNRTVWMITRDGVVTEFPPHDTIRQSGRYFEICKETEYRNVNFNISTNLDEDSTYQMSAERKIYADQEFFDSKQVTQYLSRYNMRYVSYQIESEDFDAKKYTYVTNLDLVLTIENPKSGIAHPLTLHGDHFNLFFDAYKDVGYKWFTSICILLIDNDDLINDRYINFSGSVVKVRKRKDATRPSGLYIFSQHDDIMGSPKFYHLNDLESSGINFYNNKDDALTGGNAKAIYESEILKQKHEIERLRQQNEKDSLNYKAELEEQIFKNKQYEAELRKRDMEFKEKQQEAEKEFNAEKREYEKATYNRKERKDFYEDVKWIVTITVSLAVAYLTYKKATSE